MRRAPRPLQPTGIQARYLTALRKRLARVRALVRERLVARLPDLVERATALHLDALSNPIELGNGALGFRAAVLHFDAPHPPAKRASQVLRQLRKVADHIFEASKLERLARQVASATSDHQREQLQRQTRARAGVELSSVVDRGLRPRVQQFTAENVRLIKSIPAKYLDDVERVVHEGMRVGRRHEEIARDIEERYGVAQERAALIARDQVLKFQGDLNRLRQRNLGVEQFIWRTARDERVREAHAERDGETFSWVDPPGDADDPGDGAFPGDGIRCRCFAEPIFSEEDVE